jgi:hypothetical protein
MDALFEFAGRALAGAYMTYLVLLAALGFIGLHLGVLAVLLFFIWRRETGGRRQARVPRLFFPLELAYGFVNPLIYLLFLEPYGAIRPRRAIDDWMVAVAWTLLAAIWGTRILLPRPFEVSPTAKRWLARLCVVGLVTLAAFALSDLTRSWWPLVAGTASPSGPHPAGAWLLLAFAPLYLIPALLLNGYRALLAEADAKVGFLLLSRHAAHRLAACMAVLVLVTVAASAYRPTDSATRARIDLLAPAIAEAANRYHVDAKLIAAIVYVTEREQLTPLRGQLERFAIAAFLVDAQTPQSLGRRFDLSIGVAQIKPVTALTALKLCKTFGQPWDLWYKHLRDVPELGPRWQLGADALEACKPPVQPVPVNKPAVVSALRTDDGNVAFAGLILGLYQWQWRSANPEWDISSRPDILATLYQIGFTKSRPHAAPRSNAFGARVAEVSRERWLVERFEAPRLTLGR